MNKNIDLENSSLADLKNIFSRLTLKSWGLLLTGPSILIGALVAIGFIDFPWVNAVKVKENKSVAENDSYGILVAKYGAHKKFFRGGYLHVGSSTVQSCINDYKKSFNEVGAEFTDAQPDSVGSQSAFIQADLNGHAIYAYCYLTASKTVNSHAVLFANGVGATNSEAQKSADLAGVNLDSVISHLKGVKPL